MSGKKKLWSTIVDDEENRFSVFFYAPGRRKITRGVKKPLKNPQIPFFWRPGACETASYRTSLDACLLVWDTIPGILLVWDTIPGIASKHETWMVSQRQIINVVDITHFLYSVALITFLFFLSRLVLLATSSSADTRALVFFNWNNLSSS